MIRLIKPADHPAVAAIVEPAFIDEFGRSTENALIAQLREDGDVLFELVAEHEGEITGHILYSRLWAPSHQIYAALAPMAVKPGLQKTGIGSALIRSSLDMAREFGVNGILVLGHPEYYARFGFSVETAATITSPYSRSPAFQGLALEDGAFDLPMTVAYPSAFSA